MSRVISTRNDGPSPHPNDKLTKAQLGRLPEGEHPFGEGLSLVVRPLGEQHSKSPVTQKRDLERHWAHRIEVAGQPRDIRLGTLPKVTKKQARAFAQLNRLIARAGGDPGLPVADPFEPAMEMKPLFLHISEWATADRDGGPSRVTDLMVRQAKPGRHSLGGCLILRVLESGLRSFFARVTVNGKRIDRGLGSYPLVTLAEARVLAEEYRSRARLGEDPRRSRPTLAPTFREAVPLVIDHRKSTWRAANAEAQYRRALELYALPKLGGKRVDEITVDDCYAVVRPLWEDRRGSRGYRLRHRLVHVMDWACNQGYRSDNPAGRVLLSRLPPVRSDPKPRPSLPYTKARAALEALQVADVPQVFKLFIPFLMLTGVRLSEASGAVWSEIKLERALWVIPARRMKGKKYPHRVPLSRQAMGTLRLARELSPSGELIFGYRRGRGAPRPVASRDVSKVLQKVLKLTDDEGRGVVAHGFRATITDWMSDNANVSDEVSQAVLAHRPPSATRRAYMRNDYLKKRAPLMQAWADVIMPEGTR